MFLQSSPHRRKRQVGNYSETSYLLSNNLDISDRYAFFTTQSANSRDRLGRGYLLTKGKPVIGNSINSFY